MREPSARFIVLRDLMANVKALENSLEEVADIHDTDTLRQAADVLQAMREQYWPLYLRASADGEAAGDE